MALSDHIKKDTPTNNFATLNPLTEPNVTTGHTFSDGNLKLAFSTAAGVFPSLLGSIAIPNDTGVWYWEVHYTTTTFNSGFGIYNENTGLTTDYGGSQANLTDAGFVLFNGSTLKTVYLNTITEITSSLSSPIIFQLIFDAANRKLFIKYNDTEPSGQSISSGTSLFPVFSAGKKYIPAFYHGDGGSGAKSGTFIINHGQDPTFGGTRTSALSNGSAAGDGGYTNDANGDPTNGAFYYTPPAGAKALCTANLEDITPDVDDDVPEDYFDTFIYSASGSSVQQFAHGFSFTPDLLWIKNRSSSAGSHWIYDRVRGFTDYDLTAGKGLSSASTGAEGGDVSLGAIIDPSTMSIPPTYDIDTHITIRDGNSAGVDTYNVNYPGHDYVLWSWKAGGAPTTDNISNSGNPGQTPTAGSVKVDGQNLSGSLASASIYPTRMSVNTEAGFSIIKYGGSNASSSTVPHGLGKAPEMIIVKNLDSADQWVVYHKSVASDAETDYLVLNTTAAAVDNATVWNDTAPTTQVFSIGQGGSISEPNENYIAYCWHSVEGYSAFGSFAGNGSTDGPFVYTGFKPAFVMTKLYTGTSNADYHSWSIYDNARITNNPVHSPLYANRSHAEGKRGNTGGDSGGDVLYVDFLSNGFKCRANGTELNGTSSDKFIYMAFAEQPTKYATAR